MPLGNNLKALHIPYKVIKRMQKRQANHDTEKV
jgi:hypothetical protein